MARKNIGSGTEWEDKAAYSRAVRVGNIIEVAGTTAMDDDDVVSVNDVYGQTSYILMKIQENVESLGGKMSDIVRTRIYVTDMENWEEIAKAHKEFFQDIRPVCTLIEVYSLIDPELMVEIEATAILES